MLGAIFGDVVGSVYEFNNIHTKAFPLFSKGCTFTDDTVMTVAVAETLLGGADDAESFKARLVRLMRDYGRRYPGRGYGGRFGMWLADEHMGAYRSFGNGSAMRVSPVAYAASSLEEALQLAALRDNCRRSYEVTVYWHRRSILSGSWKQLCILRA